MSSARVGQQQKNSSLNLNPGHTQAQVYEATEFDQPSKNNDLDQLYEKAKKALSTTPGDLQGHGIQLGQAHKNSLEPSVEGL